ncbi:14089_t:CDS:2 [Funneliformis geosporum]|uniref:14089_t:CDS:1 n=1 Tax=Funneliformis geosporum TaxID=1117311 RepID=A0A9W4WZ36_9GLOM|nr:14089_t:CDS:2 [Funneliformis geosporum]
MSDNINLPECEWGYSITNCNYDSALQAFYICSDILYLIVTVGAAALLAFRIIVRKGQIWKERCFSPLEGYLLGIIIFGAARTFTNIVQQMDWFSNNPILREVIYDFSWFPGDLTIATYLTGIFRTLPKMSFYRFSNQNTPTIFLLKESQITSIARLHIPPHTPSKFLCLIFGFHWAGYGLVHLCFVMTAAYYGKILVELTKNSFTLAGGNDEENITGKDSIKLDEYNGNGGNGEYVRSETFNSEGNSSRKLTKNEWQNLRIIQNIRKSTKYQQIVFLSHKYHHSIMYARRLGRHSTGRNIPGNL